VSEPSSTQTPAAPISRRFSLRRLFSIIITLIVAGLIADAASWLYPAWKKSRADTFASQAQAAFEVENFREAEENVQAALRIRANDPRFLRLAARIYAVQKKAEAVPYFEALLKTADAVDRDRYDFIGLSLLLGRPEIAEPLVKQLRAQKPINPQALYYAALWHESKGELPEAIELVRDVVEKNGAGSETRILLARLLIESREGEKIAEAKKILFEVASRDHEDRVKAIRLLAGLDLSQRELLQLARWLRDSPVLRVDEFLLSYELLYRANTNSLPKLAAEAVARLSSGRPLERAALGHWLNRHRLFELTLTNIPADFKSPTMTAVRLDALIGARRWSEALELGKGAEHAGTREIASAIYQRLSTNSPVSEEAAEALRRIAPPVDPGSKAQ
jgi:tetratricopeptide (TPR) repeat protein